MRILVTGSAGFIGFHVCKKLLELEHEVWGIDSLSDYYDVNLKKKRHAILRSSNNFVDKTIDLSIWDNVNKVFQESSPQVIVHLAAQAGVRYSIEHPESYVSANLIGTYNLLEAVKRYRPEHYLFASTSSVYGASKNLPYSEKENTDRPLSFYASTKKAGELLSHSYSHLYGIPITCFRFFTVYGPWGRPDMALFKFTKSILEGKSIDVYNDGDMYRDFTYVEDLVRAIVMLMEKKPKLHEPVSINDTLSNVAPWRIVNIGNSKSEKLMNFIQILEGELGMRAAKNFLPMQAGDVEATYADCTLLFELTGYRPSTNIAEGIANFVAWYKEYYRIS